jgi:hypothetical protein
MSLQVELEPDDRKFISGVKEVWADMKKYAAVWIVAVIVGFTMGKIYTWDSIISDCKVLGTFRIANTPFHCKMMAPTP